VPQPGVQYSDQYVESWYLDKYIGQYQKALVEAIGN
jgi:hypothetical protein